MQKKPRYRSIYVYIATEAECEKIASLASNAFESARSSPSLSRKSNPMKFTAFFFLLATVADARCHFSRVCDSSHWTRCPFELSGCHVRETLLALGGPITNRSFVWPNRYGLGPFLQQAESALTLTSQLFFDWKSRLLAERASHDSCVPVRRRCPEGESLWKASGCQTCNANFTMCVNDDVEMDANWERECRRGEASWTTGPLASGRPAGPLVGLWPAAEGLPKARRPASCDRATTCVALG
jgi:hypothetical protein